MKITTKKSSNTLLVIGIVVFLTVGVFGFGSQMQAVTAGKMGGCLFTGISENCTMTFSQHVSSWQSMFISIPAKATTLSLALLALGLLMLGSSFLKKYFIWALERMTALQKLYLAHHPNLNLFSPLKEVFSRGILNPKIYGLAIV